MKSGCYLTIALLTGLILLDHYVLSQYVDPPEVWIGSVLLGVATWLSIGAVWNAWALTGIVRALRHAAEGLTPKDGELSAVEGIIQPYGSPTLAPLSRKPCVIYEYEMTRRVQSRSNGKTHTSDLVDFCGIGMAPCEVQTEQQTIALMGYPELDAFETKRCEPGTRPTARDHVRNTEWEDYSGFRVIHGFSQMLGALTASKEEVHRDFRMVSAKDCPWLRPADGNSYPNDDGYNPVFTEKRISVGQRVVAIGVYRADAEALTTKNRTSFQRLVLLPGPLADEYAKAKSSRRSYFIGGLIALCLVHAIAGGLLWRFVTFKAQQEQKQQA